MFVYCTYFDMYLIMVTNYIMYFNILLNSIDKATVHSGDFAAIKSFKTNYRKYQSKVELCSCECIVSVPYTRTRGKFCKTSFQFGLMLTEVQKHNRDERTQEDYPTSAKIHSRCRVVFLSSFISALFLYFFSPIPTL